MVSIGILCVPEGEFQGPLSIPPPLCCSIIFLFFFVYRCGEKIGLKSPKLHTQGPPGICQGGLREYAVPLKAAKNRGFLILRAHVSPHLGAEAWAQVVVSLATRQPEPNNPRLRTREPTGQPSAPEPGSPPAIV